MTPVSYRIIRFPEQKRYIAVAWNYEAPRPALYSTRDCASYTQARIDIDSMSEALGCYLKWFDGFYGYDSASGQIVTADPSAGLTDEHPENFGTETYPNPRRGNI